MKCYNHPDVDAVGTCPDCNRGLCRECTQRYSSVICDECNDVRLKNDRAVVIRSMIITGVFAIIPFIFLPPVRFNILISDIVFGYMLAGLPWGWIALNRITPAMFLWLSIPGWLIYFFIKVLLSFCIGFFVMPFKIYGFYKEFKKFKSVNEMRKAEQT